MRRRPARIALVVAGAAIGCRGGGRDPVARSVERGIEEQLGVEVERVRCAAAGCQVEVAGGAGLAVALEAGTGREVSWTSDEVIVGAAVAAQVRAQLDELGLAETVTCPVLQPASERRVECALGGGGRAWVEVGGDGELTIEVALTAGQVEVRTADGDGDELERLSRSLDSDDAEGADRDSTEDPDPGVGGGDRQPGDGGA